MDVHDNELAGGGELVLRRPRPPGGGDDRLVVAVGQVGRQLATVARWYGQCGDLSVMPGAAALRQVARDIRLLAAELHERAEEIDGSSSEPDKSG